MSFQLNNLMKQAQDMQKKMQQAQKEIEDTTATGEAGGGVVKVIMNGKHRAQFKLDKAFFEETHEVMEDLLAAAHNSAVQKIEELSKQKLASITSGLNLPEGFGGTGDAT